MNGFHTAVYTLKYPFDLQLRTYSYFKSYSLKNSSIFIALSQYRFLTDYSNTNGGFKYEY